MRVDKPTLMCDRCEVSTQDLVAMGSYIKLTHYHMSVNGRDEWDFCPDCWTAFKNFMGDV